ncbi:MAG: SGNH/GDSL hydrolase family protein [Planctomycetes bacterium]|nr:SGNH/GDSL hydrolase family protein [Planctomycetota bacterium]
MIENATESTPSRLRTLAARAFVAVAFLIVFEWGARAVGSMLPEKSRKDAPWTERVLEFTKDPCTRADPYLGFAGTPALFRIVERHSAEVYETSPNKGAPEDNVTTYRKETFQVEKDPRGIRIFCIGGSSVQSSGMPNEGTFPYLLQVGLKAIAGGAPVEVINCGGGGTGSYQYREIAREVCHYGADLIVIYPEAGERKYLPPSAEGELADRDSDSPTRAEARRWLTRSRLYIGIRDLFEWFRPQRSKSAVNTTFSYIAIDAAHRPFSNETFTRVFDFKKDRVPPAMAPILEYDKIERAHAHFVENMTRIVEESKAAGVPVVLVDTVRNLKHDLYLRFHVEPRDVDPNRAEEWRKHYKTGVELKKGGRFEQAYVELTEAQNCYTFDRDEILHVYIGQCLEGMGRFEKAKLEYEASYLKHPLKLKLNEVAQKTGAPIVDPYPELCKRSPHGIPDSTMFMDSFHPMPETNCIIAEEILQFMAEKGAVARFARTGPAVITMAKQQMRNAANSIDVLPDRKLQIAMYQGDFPLALELTKRLAPEQKNFLTLMYTGYVQSKLNDFDGARQTWLQLKKAVLGPRENVMIPMPSLDTDADVVRHLFDGDLFSEF